MTYGALVWTKGSEGNNLIAILLAPLRKVQNISLRRITSIYRAASIPNLKWEIKVEPINLYLKKTTLTPSRRGQEGPYY